MIRIVDKKGVLRYKSANGKFVNKSEGQREWINENIGRINSGRIPKNELSKNEKISVSAKNRLRFNGKFISKSEEKFVRDRARESGEYLPPGTDIATPADLGGLGFIIRPKEYVLNTRLNFWSNPDSVTRQSVFSAPKIMRENILKGNKVTLKNGKDVYTGAKAIEALKEWERDIRGKNREEGLKVMFNHKITEIYNQNGGIEIFIDLADTFIIESEM